MTNEDLKRFYENNEKVQEPGDFVRVNKNGFIGGYARIFEVTSITSMNSDLIDILQPGDAVIKNESGNKHTYVVTYKQEKTGICLSYFDATITETVSYDYTGGVWVYNSTDVGHLSEQ